MAKTIAVVNNSSRIKSVLKGIVNPRPGDRDANKELALSFDKTKKPFRISILKGEPSFAFYPPEL
jgi:hypothetical protein